MKKDASFNISLKYLKKCEHFEFEIFQNEKYFNTKNVGL